MLKLTLNDGSVLEGTNEEIRAFLRTESDRARYGKYGNETVYLSATKGPILIADMNERHIINAIVWIYREWMQELNKLSITDFLNVIDAGPQDKTLLALVERLTVIESEM